MAAFAPVWNCEFVNWDDLPNFVDNPHYRGLSLAHLRWMFTTVHGGPYQPLSWVTLAIDHALWGMNPRGYHLTNLAVHTANALLMYGLAHALLRRSLGAVGAGALPPEDDRRLAVAAAVAALVFAIHPLRVESVAWVTERRDVLSGFFLLLTVLAYLRMADARPTPVSRTWFAVSLACFVLSLLSKAAGMVLPVLLLVLDVYPLRRMAAAGETRGRIVAEKLPFVALACAAMAIAVWGQRAEVDLRSLAQHGIAARVMQAGYGVMFYLGKTLWPANLSPLYLLRPDFDPWAPRYVLCALGSVAVTVVLIRMRHRWPWALAAWASYVVTVAPVSGIVQSGPQIAADRYTYIACLPWALLAGAAVYRFPVVRRPLAAIIGAVMLLALGALTFRQTRVWTNGVTLWDHALRLDPDNYVALGNRGWLQMRGGDLDGAVAYYDAALRVNPRFADAYRSRGFVRHRRDDLHGAIADYTLALEIEPRHRLTYLNRGLARQNLGDLDGALADYSRAIQSRDPNPLAYRNRGFIRRARGDVAGAADDFRNALHVAPSDWPYRSELEQELESLAPHTR